MSDTFKSSTGPSSSSVSRRLQFAIPMIVGVGFIGLFIYLLVGADPDGGESKNNVKPKENPSVAQKPKHSNLPVSVTEIHPKEILKEAPPKPPMGLGAKRWNIDPLPKGWDPKIAEELAKYFDKIHYDYDDPDAYVEAFKNLEALKEYLKTLDGEAVPTLAAVLNHETFFINRRQVILTLGELGPENEDSTFHLRDFFNKRKGNLKNSPELNYVIKAMGKLKNETAPGIISQMIADESNTPDYRAGFIRALGDHPDNKESIPLFVENMLNAKAFKMRNNSAQALGKIRDPQTLPDLESAYEKEPYWVAKQTILGTMGKIGSPTSLNFLGNTARTAKEAGVRLSAASAISRIYESTGSAHAYNLLEEISNSEPDAGVRQRVIKWMHEGRK